MKRQNLRMLSYLPIAVVPLLIVMSVAHVGANGNNLIAPQVPCNVPVKLCAACPGNNCCACIQINRKCGGFCGCAGGGNRTCCRGVGLVQCTGEFGCVLCGGNNKCVQCNAAVLQPAFQCASAAFGVADE